MRIVRAQGPVRVLRRPLEPPARQLAGTPRHMSHALLGLFCEEDCWAGTTYMNCALVRMAQRCDVLVDPS